MRAVILAGGFGTRLRPYTTVIPKPLVPVGDRPILEHIILNLARHGVTDVDLCVSHLGELIQAYFSQVTLPDGVRLHWHWEDEPLGTAGALRTVEGLDGTFLAMNGDILTNVDYSALVAHHRATDAALTIAMHVKPVNVDLGVIETDGSGFVTGYIEKPTLHYDVSMGIYCYEQRALRHLPDGPCQFPDLVLRLVEAGERVATYRTDAAWYDIGTLSEYERAQADLEANADLWAS